jgi:two-component system, OmpR family, sensor histidine kinase KdpD
MSGHTVDLQVADGVDAYVDPVAVERILANLLSNASKYAPPETTITVAVERVGDRARLRVADQGPGIPAEERARVFVRFYRLSNPETIRTRGAGIGLAILRDFADQSNATVTIEDAPGGGAVFIVDFPTAPAADAAAPSGARAGEVVP